MKMHGPRLCTTHLDVSGGSRIFLREAPSPTVGVLSYYFANFLRKTAWKWKNLDPKGSARPWRPPGSTNGCSHKMYLFSKINLWKVLNNPLLKYHLTFSHTLVILQLWTYIGTFSSSRSCAVLLLLEGMMNRVSWFADGCTYCSEAFTYLLTIIWRHSANMHASPASFRSIFCASGEIRLPEVNQNSGE